VPGSCATVRTDSAISLPFTRRRKRIRHKESLQSRFTRSFEQGSRTSYCFDQFSVFNCTSFWMPAGNMSSIVVLHTYTVAFRIMSTSCFIIVNAACLLQRFLFVVLESDVLKPCQSRLSVANVNECRSEFASHRLCLGAGRCTLPHGGTTAIDMITA
jgi:hypothetical protein